MKRYIDAEKLSANLLKQWKTADKEKAENISNIISSVVVPIVADTPTEDVTPVIHAQWIEYETCGEDETVREISCSNCGATIEASCYQLLVEDLEDLEYCFSCGAKMDEVK